MDLGIDNITDVEPIGSGGSASVYRARQPRLGRTVAVKVLHGTDGDKVIRRFEREARALGTLSEHPGIVTVYEVGTTTTDHPYLIMQHCPGGSLQDVIDDGQPMPAPRARDLIAQVATTLAVAHERGVLHRDLKPANLLIDGSGRAVVADFGIAALSHATDGVTASILFTPGFASPESLRGEPPAAEGDVYSLGATLYALVTGQIPFAQEATEKTGYAVAIRALSEDLPDTRASGVPEDIAQVIERATSRNSAERPTMNDIALMLRGGHVKAPSQPPSQLRPSAAHTTRDPGPATTHMPRPVPHQAAPPPRPQPVVSTPQRKSIWPVAATAVAVLALIVGAVWILSATLSDTDDGPDTTAAVSSAETLDDDSTANALTNNTNDAEADSTDESTGDPDPLGLCDAGSTLIHGGESFGAPDSNGDIQVAICLQPSGVLEYFGLETATNLSIRLPACQAAPGRYVANNSGSIYTVTNDLAAATPSVSLVSPSGVQQFDYLFDTVHVGAGASELSSATPSC